MRISIGTDHGGVELRAKMADFLRSEGHRVMDHGPFETLSVDYLNFCIESSPEKTILFN